MSVAWHGIGRMWLVVTLWYIEGGGVLAFAPTDTGATKSTPSPTKRGWASLPSNGDRSMPWARGGALPPTRATCRMEFPYRQRHCGTGTWRHHRPHPARPAPRPPPPPEDSSGKSCRSYRAGAALARCIRVAPNSRGLGPIGLACLRCARPAHTPPRNRRAPWPTARS
jgi:hypothetical protein